MNASTLDLDEWVNEPRGWKHENIKVRFSQLFMWFQASHSTKTRRKCLPLPHRLQCFSQNFLIYFYWIFGLRKYRNWIFVIAAAVGAASTIGSIQLTHKLTNVRIGFSMAYKSGCLIHVCPKLWSRRSAVVISQEMISSPISVDRFFSSQWSASFCTWKRYKEKVETRLAGLA